MTQTHISTPMPYIILAPGYKESSLGIQVIHRLCHLLNESGQSARLIECDVNPAWNTPVISFEDYLAYSEGGESCIAIYPEVVQGNPLNAPVVVRYMLNREGVIEKKAMNAKGEDLFFWYRSEFAGKAFAPDMLELEAYDTTLFCDDSSVKDLDLLYINRVPRQKIDFTTLPAGIRVLSMEQPLSLSELAAVLKRGRVLYTYESSGTCFLANLCGCPVVARSMPGFEILAVNEDTVRDVGGGVSWSDAPEEIARTRQALPAVRQWLFAKREKLAYQLQRFIVQTQQRAAEIRQWLPQYSVQSWLTERELTAQQQQQVVDNIARLPQSATLLIVVRNDGHSRASLDRTLASLAACHAHYPHFRVALTTPLNVREEELQSVSILSDSHTLQHAEEQWLQVVDAGVTFCTQAFCNLGLSLSNAPECFALFADELKEEQNGELVDALRPDFNLDLVLSTPWLYSRRWLFRRDAVNSIALELDVSLVAWELEAITRLIEQHEITGIGHLSEPLLVVPERLLAPDQIDIAVIQRHLQQRGYPDSWVQCDGDKPWQLCYGDTQACVVSIILPACNSLNNLQVGIELMLAKTAHEQYEIIIVRDAATDAAVSQWLDSIIQSQTRKIQVVSVAGKVNQAALYNAGAAAAQGDFILLINPHLIVIQQQWLTCLLNHAQRPEVGYVGGKIVSLNRNLILSAGEMLGGEEMCIPVGYGASMGEAGYMQRLQSDQNYTVLNYACLLIKKEAWICVAGLDEELKTLKQQNIDLCLKLRRAGYMAVWTPHSVIACDDFYLYPSGKAVTTEEQQADSVLHERWFPLLLRDPAYNDNFSPLRKLFRLECRPGVIAPAFADRALPLVLGVVPSGNTLAPDYHVTAIQTLARKRVIDAIIMESALDYASIYRANADALVISSELQESTRAVLVSLKKRPETLISLMTSPSWIADKGRQGTDLTGIDRLVVQNDAQAKALRHLGRPVVIQPRSLSLFTPQVKALHFEGMKPRILCNTCELSSVDIELVQNLVRELASEVSWQVLGPLPAGWEAWIEQHYRYPGSEYYLPLLASIETDLAIIPRADNKLNRLKDHFSLMEFAACTIPALVSDVESLRCHIPALRVRNRKADWQDAIWRAAADRTALKALALSAQQSLRKTDWLTDETVNEHLRIWLS